MNTNETTNQDIEGFMGASEMADCLGVSRAFIYRLCQDGKLPHYRFAGIIRVQSQDFKRFLEKSRKD